MKKGQDLSSQDSDGMFKTEVGNWQLFLISVVVLMLFMGPTVLLGEIIPSGNWQILPLLVAIVAAEGARTTRWLRSAQRGLNRSFYRLAEAIFLIVVITLFYWLTTDTNIRGKMLDNFLVAPLSIFNTNLIILISLCLLAWAWSNQLTGIFSKLVVSRDELEYFTTPSSERIERGIAPVVPVYRNRLYHEFIHHWAIGGLLLAFLAMVTTIEMTSGNIEAIQSFDFRVVTRLGLPPVILIALVIYFSAGFWLASRARLAVMQARWVAGGLEIESSILSSWRQQVIIIILVVSVLAAFLPIGSTLAISEIIQVILTYSITALSILLGLVPLLIAGLLSLFSSSITASEPLPIEKISPIVPNAESSEPIFEIPPIIFQGLFIASVLIVILVALLYFLRNREFRFDLARLIEPWSRLISLIYRLWRRISTGSTELVGSIRMRLETVTLLGREQVTPWRFLPIRGRSPRERIRHYYLSVLDQAEKQGVRRAPGETPLEHQQNLRNSWPEVTREINDLTQLFQEARYSGQPITLQAENEAKTISQRLRAAVRRSIQKVPVSEEVDSETVDP
ncbi:MAG TPA: DUF4129 domain-containing protein [Patescibacteria group bacterium]|nr:DUF4129 domain-containing protein [Patescibacteria group bacterium]